MKELRPQVLGSTDQDLKKIGLFQATRLISPSFIEHTKRLYELAKLEPVTEKTKCVLGKPCTDFAVPGYITAAAAVEAFVNEAFISGLASHLFPKSPFWRLPDSIQEFVERMRTADKIIEVPLMVLGKSLKKGENPYQDFALLLRLRNGLMHYKYRIEDRVIEDADVLARRNIAHPTDGIPWVDSIGTVEGIRWAHNTALTTIQGIIGLLPKRPKLLFASAFEDLKVIPAT